MNVDLLDLTNFSFVQFGPLKPEEFIRIKNYVAYDFQTVSPCFAQAFILKIKVTDEYVVAYVLKLRNNGEIECERTKP